MLPGDRIGNLFWKTLNELVNVLICKQKYVLMHPKMYELYGKSMLLMTWVTVTL